MSCARRSKRCPVRTSSTRSRAGECAFSYSTLERWFYRAVQYRDPLHELRRRVRNDAGEFESVSLELREAHRAQYREHPTWSYQLHYENLGAVVEARPELGSLPSYTTVRRCMRAQGFVRQKRRTDHRVHHSPREVRSYEMADAHARLAPRLSHRPAARPAAER